jgi:membrane fusion protein, multidrug efflux system
MKTPVMRTLVIRTPVIRTLMLTLAAGLLAPVTLFAGSTPSVLVRTEMPRQGSVPDILTVYGTAMPAVNGGMTLSVQQEGRVSAIAVTPGEKVSAGQRLLDFSASAAATSAFEQAGTALSLAQAERAHMAQLLRQQLATRDQFAQTDKTVSDAQAALDALRREGGGQPVRSILAPFDGIIETIPVAQGDRIQPGAPLATMTRLDGLVVTVGIEPGDQGRVRAGQAARLVPLSGGTALDCQVLRVDAILNPRTRMVDADIAVPVGAVMPGMAFQADITVGQLRGWIVPHDAVLTDERSAYVFQAGNGKAARVDVTLLGGRDGQDVVNGALDPSNALVVQGNYQLENGMAVREPPEPPQAQAQGRHE